MRARRSVDEAKDNAKTRRRGDCDILFPRVTVSPRPRVLFLTVLFLRVPASFFQ
jgi:hypothetical protein